MPSWKKVILSGSDAALNTLSVSNSITASVISASQFTGSLFGTSSWAIRAVSSSYLNGSTAIVTNATVTNLTVNSTATINTLNWGLTPNTLAWYRESDGDITDADNIYVYIDSSDILNPLYSLRVGDTDPDTTGGPITEGSHVLKDGRELFTNARAIEDGEPFTILGFAAGPFIVLDSDDNIKYKAYPPTSYVPGKVYAGSLTLGNTNLYGINSNGGATTNVVNNGAYVAKPASPGLLMGQGGLYVFESASMQFNASGSLLSPVASASVKFTLASDSSSLSISVGKNDLREVLFISRSGNFPRIGVGKPTSNASLDISGSVIVTGSTTSTGGFTGSLLGTSSWAQSASNAVNAQTSSFLSVGTYNITASWAQSASNAINARTASFVNNLNQDLSITGAVILSGSPSPELRVIGDTQFTGSVRSTGGFTGSLLGTSSWATNALTASFLPVGTYNITASWAINALTASLAPNYVLTSVTSSMLAPYVLNSQTSSFVQNSQTSSFVQNSQTSSMTVLSSSFALTASFAPNYVLTSVTSSMLAPYVLTSVTSSMLAPYVLSSQTSSFVQNNQTSSFVRNNQTSSMTVLSSSFALTASFLPVATYNITSSWAQSASNAVNSQTASFLPVGTYNITSSWAQSASNAANARTASFVNNLNQDLSITGAVILSGSSLPELRVIGETQFTGSVGSTGGFTGSLLGTSSWATNALTASFLPVATYNITASWAQSASNAVNAQTASFLPVGTYNITSSWATNALTASFVNTLNQNLIITGTVSIGTSSIGPNENTLTLGARDTINEGGQLGLNAPGGTYTSASFIDVYQNRFRVLRGTNTSSDAELFSVNLHTGQLVTNRYTGSGAFPGTAAGYLAVDTAGNVITAAGVGGGVTQIIAGTNVSISPAGGTGIVTINSTGGSGSTFPYTGSAIISGSLIVTGSTTSTGGFTGSLLGTASQALTASFALTTPPLPNQPLLFIYSSSGASAPTSVPSGYVIQQDDILDNLYVSTQSYNNVNLAPIGFASYYFTEIGSLVTLRATGSGAFRTYRVINYNSSTNYSQYTTQLTTTIASGTINNGDTVEFRWDKSAEVGNLSEGLFIDIFNTYNNEGIDIYFGNGVSIAPGITNTSILSYTGSGYIAAAITKSANLTINSLNATQGLTGSLLGTSSWTNNATTASYVLNAVSSSFSSTASFTPNAITTASVNLNTITFTKGSGATFNITVNTGSGGGGSVGTLAQVTALGASTTVPITASIISASSFTGSLFGTASWANNARTASFLPVGTYSITSSWATNALTSSFVNNLNQNLSITGAVILSGSSLPELRVIGETQFTGSVNSLNGFTGSLLGTSSFATTASYALNGGVTSIAAGSGISINQSTGNITITNTGGGGTTFPYTGSAIISGSLIVTGNLDTTQGGIDAIRIKETSLTNAGQYDRGVTLADTWSSSGPTLTAGRVVYLSGSGQWAEAVASATGSSTGVLGVVTTTANQNDIVLHGLVRVSQSLAGFTNGKPVYLSPLTAGTVTETPPSTSGQVGRYVGYIIDSASRQIYFNPDFTWIQL